MTSLTGAPLPVRHTIHRSQVFGRHPIVKFADQDNGWNTQLLGGNAAQRIIGHRGLELQFIRNRKKTDGMS